MKYSRISTVHRNGSSLAVVIPSEVCNGLGIERGDQIVVIVRDETEIILRKVTQKMYKALTTA